MFLVLANGEDCFCYDAFPYAQLRLVPSENEMVSCSITCNGTEHYLCGGPNATNVYIGSKSMISQRLAKDLNC